MTEPANDDIPVISLAMIGGYGISTDNTTAALAITDVRGAEVRIIFPLNLTAEFLTAVRGIYELVQKSELKPGQAAIKDPIGYAVGSNAHMPGATLIIFNQNTPGEEMYRFTDEDALNFADAIRKEIGAKRVKQREQDKLVGKPTIFGVGNGHVQ